MPSHLEQRKGFCEIHGEYIGVFNKNTGTLSACGFCESEKVMAINAEKHRLHLFSIANIPLLYEDKGLSDYQTKNEGQKQALMGANIFLENYHANPSKNLVMVGTTGTGKTHLAIGIIKNLINQGIHCRYTTLNSALSSIKNTYSIYSEQSEDAVMALYLTPKVLVLDEVGLTKLSDTDNGLLYRIIDMRYINKQATIVISNLFINEFKEFVGDRIADRLRAGNSRLIDMVFDSYRKQE